MVSTRAAIDLLKAMFGNRYSVTFMANQLVAWLFSGVIYNVGSLYQWMLTWVEKSSTQSDPQSQPWCSNSITLFGVQIK